MKSTKIKLILLTAVALTLVLMVLNDLRRIRITNEETSTLLALAEQSSEEKALIQNVKNLQREAALDLNKFEEVVLTDNDVVEVIESIENAARSLGLTAKIISVDKGASEGGVEVSNINLTLETKGSWSNNLQFLTALESLPYRVSFESVGYAKVEEGWRGSFVISLQSF